MGSNSYELAISPHVRLRVRERLWNAYGRGRIRFVGIIKRPTIACARVGGEGKKSMMGRLRSRIRAVMDGTLKGLDADQPVEDAKRSRPHAGCDGYLKAALSLGFGGWI